MEHFKDFFKLATTFLILTSLQLLAQEGVPFDENPPSENGNGEANNRPLMPPEFANMTQEERQARMQEFAKKREAFEKQMSDNIQNAVATPNSQTENKNSTSKIAENNTEAVKTSFVSLSKLSSDNSADSLIASLLFNNPFGSSKSANATTEVTLGIYLKSIANMEGHWYFSFVSKDGKGAWLKVGEESQVLNCKVVSFDENSMSVKTFVAGKAYDMAITERSSTNASGNVELIDELKPRKRISPEERIKLWSEYASDEQKQSANQIYQAARAAGRRLNREDFRKLHDIERNIKVPEQPKGK